MSFVLGTIGSVGLFFKRLVDVNLKRYGAPMNYLNYVFFFFVFGTGFYAWLTVDPAFAEHREFWRGMLMFESPTVPLAAYLHILLFAAFLIYLPYTRSMHYISRFLAHFLILWDDRPNVRGSELERELEKNMSQSLSWQAKHIPHGCTWVQAVSGSDGRSGEAKK